MGELHRRCTPRTEGEDNHDVSVVDCIILGAE